MRLEPLAGVEAVCANPEAVSQSTLTDLGELGQIPSVEQLMLDITARDAEYKAQSPEPRNGGLDPNIVWVRIENTSGSQERNSIIEWARLN